MADKANSYPSEGPQIGDHSQGLKPSGNKKADSAMAKAVKLIDTWDKARSKRLNTIREMERAYYNDVRPNIVGRSNIPFPLLAKYVDELRAQMDNFPKLTVGPGERMAQYRIAQKMEALAQKYQKPVRGDWARKVRQGMTRSIFSGLIVVNKYSERIDGKFCDYFRVVDINDLVAEVKGGNNPDDHLIFGEFPIFKTRNEIMRMAKAGIYDQGQVVKLLRKYRGSDYKKNDEYFQNKYQRYKSVGIDMETNSYVGQPVCPLFQVQIQADDGKWYLLTGDYTSQTWVRFDPLEKMFEAGYRPGKKTYVAAQTHEDADTLLSKSCADDIYPLHEAARAKVNQMIDNATKIIWGQTGYDPNFVPDASQLEWSRPDQKIVMRSYQGKPLSNGIFQFKTEDGTKVALDMIKLFDESLASILGVNPNSITAEDQRVGVVFGNLQKQGSRLGIQNKSFKEMMDRVLERFVCGAWDNLGEPEAVKLIGTKAVEWDELKREEMKGDPDFEYNAVGANIEFELSEARKKRQNEVVGTIIKDPDLKKQVNPKVLVEELFNVGEFEEEKIKRLMDVDHYGSEDSLSRADEACELILAGKKPKIYPGADIAFYEYIYDFAQKFDDDGEDAKKKVQLMAYGRAHLQLVVRNMAMKADIQRKLSGNDNPGNGDATAASANGKPAMPAGGAPANGAPQGQPVNPILQKLQQAMQAKKSGSPVGQVAQPGVPAGIPNAAPAGPSPTSVLSGQ